MSPELWSPVGLDAKLSELANTSVLLIGRKPEDAAVVTISGDTFSQTPNPHHKLEAARVSDLSQPRVLTQPEWGVQRLSWVAETMKLGPGVEAIVLPPVKWPSGGEGIRGRLPITIIVAALVFAFFVFVVGGVDGGLVALPASILAAAIAWFGLRSKRPTEIVTAGDLHLDQSNIVDYAIARRLGERPELRTDARRRGELTARADELLEEFGQLRYDIAYRIENSALFDSAVPTTAAFNVATVKYQDGAGTLDLDELAELTRELEISYSVARDHAETVGLAHLPSTARADGRRAAKAARLAADAGTDSERDAALDQVVRILRSLALYYLPEPDRVRGELPAPREFDVSRDTQEVE